jgi:hypothetical protein
VSDGLTPESNAELVMRELVPGCFFGERRRKPCEQGSLPLGAPSFVRDLSPARSAARVMGPYVMAARAQVRGTPRAERRRARGRTHDAPQTGEHQSNNTDPSGFKVKWADVNAVIGGVIATAWAPAAGLLGAATQVAGAAGGLAGAALAASNFATPLVTSGFSQAFSSQAGQDGARPMSPSEMSKAPPRVGPDNRIAEGPGCYLNPMACAEGFVRTFNGYRHQLIMWSLAIGAVQFGAVAALDAAPALIVEEQAAETAAATGAEGIAPRVLNSANHIFGPKSLAKHGLAGVLRAFGGDSVAAFNALESGAQQVVNQGAIKGVFETTLEVAGENVTVRGAVVDGAARVSTAFIP